MSKRQLHFYAQNITKEEPTPHAMLFLPGRGFQGVGLIRQYERVFDLSKVGLFSLTPLPTELGWYPMPNGVYEQDGACRGLEFAVDVVERTLAKIENEFLVDRERIVIVGFSAGAVVGLHYMTTRNPPVGCVICHSGACLEPHKLPAAWHKNPIVLNHGEDDNCFEWEERYVPMKEALVKQGYRVLIAERADGNHRVLRSDILRTHEILGKQFGYELTRIPEIEEPVEPTDWANLLS